MKDGISLAARIGLSTLFIIAGIGKIGAYAGTQQYMEAMGVPGALLPLVIALELGGGLAILIGGFTRFVAAGLALFSIASGVLFHFDLADANQMTQLWKNLAIAGGFLMLVAHGPGALSVDAWLARRRDALPPGAPA